MIENFVIIGLIFGGLLLVTGIIVVFRARQKWLLEDGADYHCKGPETGYGSDHLP
jgi:hypothetical protein